MKSSDLVPRSLGKSPRDLHYRESLLTLSTIRVAGYILKYSSELSTKRFGVW